MPLQPWVLQSRLALTVITRMPEMPQPLLCFQGSVFLTTSTLQIGAMWKYLPTTFRQSSMELVFSEFNSYPPLRCKRLNEELLHEFTCGLTCVHHMFKLILFSFNHNQSILSCKGTCESPLFPVCNRHIICHRLPLLTIWRWRYRRLHTLRNFAPSNQVSNSRPSEIGKRVTRNA